MHVSNESRTNSLDILASNVSPPAFSGETPKPATPKNSEKFNKGTAKKWRHAMRRVSGRLMPGERVAKCGQRAIGSVVTLHHHDGRSNFNGIETCSSVWACPVCAAKITEGRKEDLDKILNAHTDAGGKAYMATFTMPHHKFQTCKELKWAVSNAWRRVKSGKAWTETREKYQWLGDVRALEITHGNNGWHPHIHVLVFFKPGSTEKDQRALGGWLFDRWARAIEKLGFGVCSNDAFTFDLADSGAAGYVGKWGASMELTKGHIKQAKGGGRTPWQILGDVSGSWNSADIRLFQEYAYAFKGARQLTWSRGLRDLYLNDEDLSDEELAEDIQAPQTHTASMSRELFDQVVSKRITAHVLAAQEEAGLKGVLSLLTDKGIPWRIEEAPGLERDTFVPMIALGHSQGPPGPIAIGKPQNTMKGKTK